MSEKTEVGQEYDDNKEASQISGNIPEHQYSREQLIGISKSPLSGRRPKCLDPLYDADDGKWDPDRWYKAQFEVPGEASPLTLSEGNDRRRLTELDRDLKRRHSSVNDPVERLKEERDGIVLSPQRRSFGTGCHVQTTSVFSRQLTVPERDESRDKDRERDRDSRDRPVRKIGSGRIQIDRENSRDYSGLRDRFDDRDVREREPDRERDFAWNREREWERDVARDRDRDVRDVRDVRESEWDRDRGDRDRRFDRSDRFRRGGDRDFPDRDRRDRDFRDRGFDRNSRRNNYRHEEKEPEWFSGGPTSQNDTIELRGFDREGVCDTGEGDARPNQRNESSKINTPSEDISSKESSEAASEPDVKVSQCSSPEEDQQATVLPNEPQDHRDLSHQTPQEEQDANIHQRSTGASPSKYFDFEAILKASILPLDEDSVCQGSRFSRFFSGINGNKLGSDTSSLEDMLVPLDLLEDSHNSPAFPSPTPMMGHMAAMPTQPGPAPHGMLPFQNQLEMHSKEHMYSLHQNQNLIPVPNPAGDNNAAFDKPALPPAVTALFNSAALGGSNASISSNSSFSTQDAEAQLKALLFGGNRDSTPSSGTASPASLPPNVQRKVKTVAELEADMHQNSPQKSSSGLSVTSSVSNTSAGTEDMAAFNKLLIMINAASEANQNFTQTEPQATRAPFGVFPSHNEFSHAVMRNKEEQMQLQQQSFHIAQHSNHSQPQLPPHHPPPHHHPPPPSHIHSHQQMLQLSQHPPPPLVNQQVQQQLQKAQSMQQQQHHHHLLQHQQNSVMNHTKQLSGLMNKPQVTSGLPPSMTSHPNSLIRPRAQSGGPLVSSDLIYSLIQQNPTIVMNPASPGPNMAAILASQQSAVPNTARVPSPLMFSQQPPLHLNAPSPIHPGQLSPRSLTVGTNLATGALGSPTGMRSPVLARVLSPQELSVHAQAVMQSALIKQQLHDQNMRYQKKQQERAKSPSQQQINAARSQSASQMSTPSLQAKGLPVNTFLPTSVLRKMHSDKALEKEKQALEGKTDEKTAELLSSMREFPGGSNDLINHHSLDSMSRKPDQNLLEDLTDISFLDPVNPELVAMSSQLENQLRIGQTNILPGSLSQPMSVEEKMKLSALAEKPGFLSQILDKSARAAAAAEMARAGQGRPIVKAQEPIQTTADDRALQQHFFALHQQQQQQQPPPPLSVLQSGRPVTGGSPKIQPSFIGVPVVQANLSQMSSMQQGSMNKPTGGRAIVGGNSAQQQSQVPSMVPSQNIDMLRLMDLQRLQQLPHSQGMVLPPPPIRTPISCLGPPPGTVPVSACIPVVGGPMQSVANPGLLHQQMVRANAMSAQHSRQISQFMARQQVHQHRNMAPLPSLHMVAPGVSAPLSPRGQASGPLSPAALSATIQRVASPHGALKMNGPLASTTPNGTGGPKVDMNSGIQRWFSPDILKNQLPCMPPLPAKGNQVMTVDELEGN